MNAVSQLWIDLVFDLNEHKTELGLTGGIERARRGKVVSVNTPGATVWLEVNAPNNVTSHGPITYPVSIVIYCIGNPKSKRDEAVDASLELAINVAKYLSNRRIGEKDTLLQTPEDGERPIEVVDESGSATIVAALLKAEVTI